MCMLKDEVCSAGPSAGSAMACALMSVALQQPIPVDVGVTGELSLTGRVLAVGGIKEKVVAAHRQGLKRLVLPADSEAVFMQLPNVLRKKFSQVTFARHFTQVWAAVQAVGEDDGGKPDLGSAFDSASHWPKAGAPVHWVGISNITQR
jgi:ATP-dependent Lon protease